MLVPVAVDETLGATYDTLFDEKWVSNDDFAIRTIVATLNDFVSGESSQVESSWVSDCALPSTSI